MHGATAAGAAERNVDVGEAVKQLAELLKVDVLVSLQRDDLSARAGRKRIAQDHEMYADAVKARPSHRERDQIGEAGSTGCTSAQGRTCSGTSRKRAVVK